MKNIFNIKASTSTEIAALENHHDVIDVNLGLSVMYCTKLLTHFYSVRFGFTKKSDASVLIEASNILAHILQFCKACNFEIPDEDTLLDFEEAIPIEVVNDSILTTLSMTGAISDLSHVLYVDLEEPIWDIEEFPEEFVDDVLTVIIGIKNLGRKHNFTIEDVLSEIVK